MTTNPRDQAVLSEDLKGLVRISAAVPARCAESLREALREALDAADPEDVEEILLQAHLFVGYPLALDAMTEWRKLRGVGPETGPEPDEEAWEDRGERVCGTVYGPQYGPLRENVRRVHPALERWMVVDGYGKVLGRGGPELRVRELCIAALLAVLETPSQLYSHLRGALNAGASPEEVEAVLTEAADFASPAARTEARETWRRVRSRRTGAGARGKGSASEPDGNGTAPRVPPTED